MDSPQPEFEKMAHDFQAAAAAVKDFYAAWQQLTSRAATLAADWHGALKKIHERLPDLQKAARQHEEDVLKLAQLGWTVPFWTTHAEISEIAALDSPEAVDSAMLALYFADDMNMFRRASVELQESMFVQKWRKLLKQVVTSIVRKDHLIAIPSLLLILEGYLAQFALPTQMRDVKIKRLLKYGRPEMMTSSVMELVWKGTEHLIDRLFEFRPFDGPVPSSINRAWILHGRSPDTWTDADALRLFNALSTLDWLRRFSVEFAARRAKR